MKRIGLLIVGTATLGAALLAVGCGSDGATGPAGPKGDPGGGGNGTAGPAGPAGPAGTAGANGTNGAKGDPGVGVGDPQISAINPPRSFLGRKTEVTISGVATNWATTAVGDVDFGAGITVDKVTVGNKDALVVNLTVAPTAAAGPRDVSVKDGSAKEIYKGAFHLDAPATLAIPATIPLAQGTFHPNSPVKMLDLSTPFDTTTNANAQFGNLTTTGGARIVFASASTFGASGLLLVDLNAEAVPWTELLTSGVGTEAVTSPLTQFTPVVRAGTVIALPAAGATTTVNSTIAIAGESSVYTVTPTAAVTLSEIAWTAPAGVANRRPLFLVPKSGKWNDAVWGADFSAGRFVGAAPRPGNLFAATHITSTADPYWVVFWDATNTTGQNTVQLKTTVAASNAVESATAVSIATAQLIGALPAAMLNGKITGDAYTHYVKVTVPAAGIGKKIRVITNGDPFCDAVVEVIAPNGTTSMGGQSDDNDYQENWLSTAVTVAGDHYVAVTPSGFASVDPAHTAYHMFIRLE